MYNFDKEVNRKGTSCIKWDNLPYEDTIPMFIADMDFEVLPEIIEAIQTRLTHPVFGYTRPWDGYYETLANWMKTRHGMDVKKEWVEITNGVVEAFAFGIQAFTEPGDSIIIQTPAYPPFAGSINKTGRHLVTSPLVYQPDGSYEIDFEDFEKKIVDENVKMFILCNPQNPCGKIYTKEDLEKFQAICAKHQVFVIADEIHADFVHHVPHTSYLNIEGAKDMCMICTAPSKTFNLAAFQTSNIFIPNDEYHKKFTEFKGNIGAHSGNLLGLVACEAAYKYGAQYVDEMNAYIEENHRYLKERLESETACIVTPLQGTYLSWINFNPALSNVEGLHDRVLEETHIKFNDGTTFGVEGTGFERINLACTKATLTAALDRLIPWVNAQK